MNFLSMVNNMPESVYLSLRVAVETGKWPDGNALTLEQKDNAFQAVLAWQAKNQTDKQHFTLDVDGSLIQKPKSELRTQFADMTQANDVQTNRNVYDNNEIIRINHNDL